MTSLADDSRALAFFTDVEYPKFSDLDTVLMVGVITLSPGTNIRAKALFDNIPIYEIPGFVRGRKKKISIPYPGIPYTVLSAKCGGEIRGILKNQKDLNPTRKNFPNQATLDISVPGKVVNVFVFGNKLKITGAKTPKHLAEAFIYLRFLVSMLNEKGLNVSDTDLKASNIKLEMVNVVFSLGFKILKDKLEECIDEEDGWISEKSDGAISVQYPMGVQKAKGGERYFNLRVLHTGSVVFSGNNRDSMEPIYDKFIEIISKHEAKIRFV